MGGYIHRLDPSLPLPVSLRYIHTPIPLVSLYYQVCDDESSTSDPHSSHVCNDDPLRFDLLWFWLLYGVHEEKKKNLVVRRFRAMMRNLNLPSRPVPQFHITFWWFLTISRSTVRSTHPKRSPETLSRTLSPADVVLASR